MEGSVRGLFNEYYPGVCLEKNCSTFYIKVKVKVSHNRPRWPKGFRVG
jgi:hypothetical protein